MIQACEELVVNQQNLGELISAAKATEMLEAYLNSEGEVQPSRGNDLHIYGHLFGLNKIKNLLNIIDVHNVDTSDSNRQITAIRIYRAKSKRGTLTSAESDLLIVPVMRNGIDFPKIQSLIDPEMILGNSGPCPNICKPEKFI